MDNNNHKFYSVDGKHSSLTYDYYLDLHKKSIQNKNEFWAEVAKDISWINFPKIIDNSSFDPQNFYIKWFEDGVLNPCYNCIDIHLPHKANDVALLCEYNDINTPLSKITYQNLYDNVCQYANAMKSLGIKKGDVVVIYMPMIKEAIFAMLALSRIGAIHCVVFTGFSSSSLADRMMACNAKYVITTDVLHRGNKVLKLKENVDEANKLAGGILTNTMVVAYDDTLQIQINEKDVDFKNLCLLQEKHCPCEPMNSLDKLFILYTSGSTSKPKGIVHACGGYMVYVKHSFKINFDYQDGEVYFSSADIGWITGHSYGVYGPLSCGAKIVIYDGIYNYPQEDRLWHIIDKYKVNILYTAPTLIRTLMLYDEKYISNFKLDSLRILGSVGEPINLDAWEWYFKMVGKSRCPIVDTWWQTETGGHMICPIPFLLNIEPTKASFPFFGVDIKILNENGKIAPINEEGYLCVASSWPGQAIDILNDTQKYIDSYFSKFSGYYLAGDGAILDENGRIRITGRMDDIMNISGHRLSSAELENTVNSHPNVVESALISIPHNISGESIYALCITKKTIAETILFNQVSELLQNNIGKFAKPHKVVAVPDLPKTRSGKIMRRLLKQIFNGNTTNLGDTSTLANPQAIDEIISIYKKL